MYLPSHNAKDPPFFKEDKPVQTTSGKLSKLAAIKEGRGNIWEAYAQVTAYAKEQVRVTRGGM